LVAELRLKTRVLKMFEWTGVKLRCYMRYSQPEKAQIILLMEESPVSVKQTLSELSINRSTFYKWSPVSAGRLRSLGQSISATQAVLEPDPAMAVAGGS
jgi:transposase-like protein